MSSIVTETVILIRLLGSRLDECKPSQDRMLGAFGMKPDLFFFFLDHVRNAKAYSLLVSIVKPRNREMKYQRDDEYKMI